MDIINEQPTFKNEKNGKNVDFETPFSKEVPDEEKIEKSTKKKPITKGSRNN